MHDFPLLTTLAAGFTAAWILGLLTQRLGLSPIVGYLLAGVVVGPYTPGFVADSTLAPQLAELGVILLMFGVGLHFHLTHLLAVRRIAIPGAIVQSATATIVGAIAFSAFGWSLTAGLVLGMATAVASTVVLIRVLSDNHQLHTDAGHAAVGWLIVEDIFTVIILVLIPALAGATAPHAGGADVGPPQPFFLAMLFAIGKLAASVVFIYVAGSRIVPWILVHVTRLRSRELFTLTVLVLSIAVAIGASELFGASVALGAFLAGMVVAQSPVSQQAGIDALPMRDAFAVLFFVAVGMLFDPSFILQSPWMVLTGLGIVMVAKPLAAIVIVVTLGYPVRTALIIAIGLAQIGEFSFIVGELAFSVGILSETGMQVIIASALVSITLNPMLFRLVGPLESRLRRWPGLWNCLNGRAELRHKLVNDSAFEHAASVSDTRAIVVGYGPVGQQVDRLLREANITTVIIDLNIDTVTALVADGRIAIYGDATRSELLKQAGADKVSHFVWTTPHLANLHDLVRTMRDLNPDARLLIRTRYLREATQVRDAGADATVVDETESAIALTHLVLRETNADVTRIDNEIDMLRKRLLVTTNTGTGSTRH